MAKTSKPGGAKAKPSKKKKSGPESIAMKVQAPKPNPFETIWSRRKFDILGKKRRGEERRVGLARSRAIEKRKKTLLKEYEQSGKSSVFVDKRIGEHNDDLGEFDKAILRSQRERQLKLNKKSKYNLSDGEEEDFDIPGFGALSERDDFGEEMLPDDDDYGGDEAADIEKDSAGLKQNIMEMGSGGDENKHKTKKEVMEEIISKSKFFKAQKAKDKEENEHLMEELDKNFASLVQSKALSALTEPGKMNALRSLVKKNIPNDQVKKDDFSASQKLDQEKPDLYDKMVKEMALEMRARPSDRTKTPEEIAQEERERLERLEEERQKRMLATDGFSDEEDEDGEKPSARRPRAISGDDLGDSFLLDEEPRTKRGWVDEILEKRDAENNESEEGDSSEESESSENGSDEGGSDEDSDAHEENPSIKDWEQSDDDNLETDLDGEEEEGEENEDDDDASEKAMKPRDSSKAQEILAIKTSERHKDSLGSRKKNADEKQPSTRLDIPYLIEAPKTLEEFCALLNNCSNSDILLIINRIRAGNAIKLAAENRKKMQVFYGVLLQYFAVLANKSPLNIELLDLLVKPLMEMSVEIPYFAAICARQRILRTRTQFCETIKNPENSCWPSSKTLFLLRLWSLIFPCSDFRHAVMTPAILLMSEYLMRCPIVSGRDIAVGSFLCSMLLSVAKQSKKFCPEAIAFLRMLLMAAKDEKLMSNQNIQYYYLMELKELQPLLCLRGCVNKIDPLNLFTIMDLPEDSSFFDSDNFRTSVLMTVVETLQGYVNIYEGLSSFPEIFLPFLELLLEVAQQESIVGPLQDKINDVAQLIKTKVHECHMSRQPLQMRKQKPVPIKMLTPKFEESFVKGRDYDPDRERAERRKLKKLLKEESKGAIRELRKDNYFLHEVKAREKALAEEERTEKYHKVKAFLEEQQHAFKSGQLGKGRKRRR
ncbi:Nucleolar protein [Trema orientale]|uniref:Nucleolar protein n=1 Tax=Trema orientale TaxID=63057 RepID=A0A2P5FHJ4_TREOI|nr:Nucleolar protein [Trema orientale]